HRRLDRVEPAHPALPRDRGCGGRVRARAPARRDAVARAWPRRAAAGGLRRVGRPVPLVGRRREAGLRPAPLFLPAVRAAGPLPCSAALASTAAPVALARAGRDDGALRG